MGSMDSLPVQTISGGATPTGSSVLSFDDIVVAPNAAASKETEGVQNGKEDQSEAEKEKEQVSSKEVEAKADKIEEKIAEASASEVKKLEKLLKVKAGDKELELPANAIFKTKVDGKEVDVDAQTLLENFSGKTAWKTRFDELNKEKQIFEKDRKSIETAVDKFYSLAKEGNYQGAVNYLLDLNGIDQRSWWKGFKDQITPQVLEYAKLSEEERAAQEQAEEIAYYRKQEQARAQERANAQKMEAIHSQVQQVLKQENLSQEEFVTNYEELKSIFKAEGANPEAIQPAHVVEFINGKKDLELKSSLGSMIKDVNPELSNEALADRVEDLKKIYKAYPGMSVEELKDIALQAWGSKAKQNLSRKLAKAKPQATPPQKHYNARSDLIDWDSIS